MRATYRLPAPARAEPSCAESSSADRSAFDNPAILWLLVVLGLYTLYPLADLRAVVERLRLPDSDDAMRLVQVRDLLAGQGWFDMVQHRLMPPGGAGMHWSRLVDAPLAGLIGLATPWLGRPLAEGIVAAAWPPALFAVYLRIVYRAVRSRFGVRPALLALFAATQVAGLGTLFAFGRIDHHNVQVLLVLLLGCALAESGRRVRAAAVGGLATAASLAVGLEALPVIVIGGLFVLGDWIVAGRTGLPAFRAFTLTLAGASLGLFLVQTDPNLWATTQCDALSPPWLWLAVGSAAVASGATVLAARLGTPLRRAGFAVACGVVVLAVFVSLAPRCLSGPFQGLPAFVRTEWLDHVREMQSARSLLATLPDVALACYGPLLLAGLVAAHAALRGRPEIRRGAALTAAFLLSGFVLAQFQFRSLYMAAAFIPLVAGPLFSHTLTLLRGPAPAWHRVATASVACLLIAQVWMLLHAPFSGSAPESAAQAPAGPGCGTDQSLVALDMLPSGLILADQDLGPSILLHSHHGVVAAPYHRAITGLIAAVEGLSGDEATLKRALATSGATYLVVCTSGVTSKDPAMTSFARRLAEGTATAPWLERLPLAGTPLAAWRVRLAGQGPGA